MSATGLDTFDKTLQITNVWLDEIMEDHGPDRQVAWHILGAVLRTIRDKLPADLSAHLGAQLPLLVRGAYYDQYRPARQPSGIRARDEFLQEIGAGLGGIRPVDAAGAMASVGRVLNHHLDPGLVRKLREALNEDIRRLWPEQGS